MAHEEALVTINLLRMGFADFVGLLLASAQKQPQSHGDLWRLMTQGMMLGADCLAVIDRLDDAGRADLLYVFEHAVLTLPPEPPAA